MPIYFNIIEAGDYLFKNKIVYTLRERKRRHLGKSQIRQGSYSKFEDIGKCRVTFVKSIKNDDELLPYIGESGFNNIKDWRKKAGISKHLYKLELL